jgi:hypothetical protein
MAAPCALVTLA